MEISLELVKEFLQKYGYNWSGYAGGQDSLYFTVSEYKLEKAKTFSEVCNSSNSGKTFFYFGDKTPTDSFIFVEEKSPNVILISLTPTEFIIYNRVKNDTTAYSSSFEYKDYHWAPHQHLTKDWVKFLIKRVPKYKTYLLETINSKRLKIVKDVETSATYYDHEIEKLQCQKTKIIEEAEQKLNDISKLEQLLNSAVQDDITK